MALALVVVASCSKTSPPQQKQKPRDAAEIKSACIADDLPALRTGEYQETCLETNVCKAQCEQGDIDACMTHAYALQRVKKYEAADGAFERACRLGYALACTNYAAAMLKDGADVECTRRVFERACAIKEAFACGMVGRLLAMDAETPAERADARRALEHACDEFAGMTCFMYALHLEEGHLGAYEAGTIERLMKRACETGDEESCGKTNAQARTN
jgi:hypothetical protein